MSQTLSVGTRGLSRKKEPQTKYLLAIKPLDGNLGVENDLDSVRNPRPRALRIGFDKVVQGEHQCPPETELAVFLEHGEAAEFVVILRSRAADRANRLEGRHEAKQYMGRFLVQAT